uniref:Leucine rich repeat containing 24 n=1 Tax=Gasterosteus aculeatus TaxID=69293 RepID=G3PN82_GASAC
QTIFLQDNGVVQIRHQDLTRLGSLHYLYLQNNSISAVEPGAFLSQGQLLELALNGNLIHLVTADMFRGLEHLRILYLAGNQITRVQDHTFSHLQRLQELHLQENSIELLTEHALSGLSSLALLDLSRNHLRTLGASSLTPLVSLQVLRVTENPWRCDCALGWLRTWIKEDGQRLLSSAEQRRLMCSEPPRLSHLSLVEVAPNSLVCIPPVVQLEPSHLTVRLGESLRVSCQASGYPQPQVTWKKASHGKAQLSPRGLVQELGPNAAEDTGSGMLFLSNVTVAHAGRYECEAWNPGGVARVTFHLAVNMSSSAYSSQFWPRLPEVLDVSQELIYEQDSMDFYALGPATQTAIAVGISLLALTAVLLLIMIYTRHQQYRKEEGGSYCTSKEESILYVNDYSDGPTTFAQLEEYRDDHGHEMYVLNRTNPVLASASSRCPMMTEGYEGGPPGPRNGSQVAYEIHC